MNISYADTKVASRDHVFYYFYSQPSPKDEALGLWSNANEINNVNGK